MKQAFLFLMVLLISGSVVSAQNQQAAQRHKSRVVELRFFVGLTVEETAEVLKVSPFTVHRDWRFAKAWLHQFIHAE